VDRLDVALGLAVVVQGLPRRLDAAGDGRVGDDAPLPHLVDDFVLRDHAIAVLDQQRQQREDLPLERPRIAARAQLDPGGVELEGAEAVQHPVRITRRGAPLPGKPPASRGTCRRRSWCWWFSWWLGRCRRARLSGTFFER